VLLTHAEGGEKELVASGAAIARRPFMENYFVIAGPASDPAGVRDAASAEEAMGRIAARPSPYVSRGDDSGTHRREQALLRGAGLDPVGGWEGFTSTGSGMGLTLQVAGERRAYTLSDLGTFLAFEKRVDLTALSKPDPSLRNVYSVLRISPQRFPGRIQAEPAARFEAFLLDKDTQRRIGEFGREKYGRPLFEPLLLEKAP
jgi:tungstate transport system substrate-binding protein